MTRRTERLAYAVYAVLAGCVVFAMARANRLVFPFPWNDEARFYLPALWWAEHLSLRPLNVNAPEGIFWVPDGFTIYLGLALRLFGGTMDVARGVMESTIAAGVVVFALGLRRLTGSAMLGAAAALLLVTPPVIFAANMVRMEAPLFLLLALALLAEVYGYWLAAAALLVGSALFHPALMFSAAGYLAVLLWRRGLGRPAAWEWALAGAVLLALAAEAVHLAAHAALFREHMAFQAERKLRVPVWRKLLKPQVGALYLCCAGLGWVFWRRGVSGREMRVAAMALGVMLYAAVGAEMAYVVYLLATGPALVLGVLCGEVGSEGERRTKADPLRG